MKLRYYIVFGLLAIAALGALAWGQGSKNPPTCHITCCLSSHTKES